MKHFLLILSFILSVAASAQKAYTIYPIPHEQILSSATFALAFALVGTFGFFAGTDVTGTESTQYGSTLLPVEAGGYVLIAVIAFLMGVIITAIAVHVRKKKRDEAETE